MGCCLVFLVLAGAPRFALFLMWLFTDRLAIALDSFLVGALGFLVIFAFCVDLTVTFGGGRAERQRRVEYS